MRLTKTAGLTFFFVHLMACFWFLSASFIDLTPDTWAYGAGLLLKTPLEQYLVSVYWAFQTITTVGFGDIAIGLTSEYLLSLAWMVFGVSFYSFTVGNVTSIIASIDTKAAILASKLATLQAYSLRIDLPHDTAMRIQKFLENDNKDIIT